MSRSPFIIESVFEISVDPVGESVVDQQLVKN